jgi:hypothetical protein
MSDYENEEWVTLYRTALLELEHAKMSGRIEATRTAIVARVENFRTCPVCIPMNVLPSRMRFPVCAYCRRRRNGMTRTRNVLR